MKAVTSALKYERTQIRTKSNKELNQLFFTELPTRSIVTGALKEIYKRYSTDIWAVVAFGELAIIVWMRLG